VKKAMVLLAVLLLASAGTAWYVGQIITQAQFNQIDFDAQSFELEVVAKQKLADRLTIDVNYTTLQKLREDQWQIVEKTRTFYYKLRDYYDCRSNDNNVSVCIKGARVVLKQKAITFREAERTKLKQHQRQAFYDEIDIDDIDINDNELN